jgi:hypothetical protein
VEEVARNLGVKLGNAADVVYRMRSRTRLPDDILDLGFVGHEIRPIVVKLTYDGVLHFLEFRATTSLAGLRILHSHGYKLNLSPKQRELIRVTRATLDSTAVMQPRLELSEDLSSIEVEVDGETEAE